MTTLAAIQGNGWYADEIGFLSLKTGNFETLFTDSNHQTYGQDEIKVETGSSRQILIPAWHNAGAPARLINLEDGQVSSLLSNEHPNQAISFSQGTNEIIFSGSRGQGYKSYIYGSLFYTSYDSFSV